MTARRQPSSRCLLAGSRDTANESRYEGSRWHDDKLVIPLRVSGIYAKRYHGDMTVCGGMTVKQFVIPLHVSGISC
ncbi:hypothetical protein [Wolbachia endosymbiont (group A) of Gymnosoma rotundatum]|uniref:hypothetical protein n=1 Tax=Wolbachia endosymbiont (group A) of Gymnosoma rotundatum TaxID=2954016 RepID=UPI002227628F|nr:hypothetical protein [Wolbachia endosymbiont (group A) of Gymnosoma rotundatum]